MKRIVDFIRHNFRHKRDRKNLYRKYIYVPIKHLFASMIYYGSSSMRNNPRIITNIDGGLGSQMGQFLFGQEIQRQTGVPVLYDLSFYAHTPPPP
ncbi:hypothetical protein AGMMS49959_02670 [Planctomycetales bacterium]|nr:hypothetical protein AGMMS49959_02670 [Planctomycetales bacterium]